MEMFLEEVGNVSRILPGFVRGELSASSLPQQARGNQHHHDGNCAEDDRPEPPAEAAAQGPGHGALWASSL